MDCERKRVVGSFPSAPRSTVPALSTSAEGGSVGADELLGRGWSRRVRTAGWPACFLPWESASLLAEATPAWRSILGCAEFLELTLYLERMLGLVGVGRQWGAANLGAMIYEELMAAGGEGMGSPSPVLIADLEEAASGRWRWFMPSVLVSTDHVYVVGVEMWGELIVLDPGEVVEAVAESGAWRLRWRVPKPRSPADE